MDSRTRAVIRTLNPAAQKWAELHYNAILASGILPKSIECKFISGFRSFAEQDRIFSQGRTQPGRIVTNARAGFSFHNFGIAWDIGLFEGGRYLTDSPLYDQLGPVAEGLGIEWGGRWKFKDSPHYQVRMGLTLAELRRLHAAGRPLPIPDAVLPQVQSYRSAPERTAVLVFAARPNVEPIQLDIPAFLETGRVWVAVRPFVDKFGGHIEKAFVVGSSVLVSLHGETMNISGRVESGVGMVKFADLNRLFEFEFTFGNGRLLVHTFR